MELFDSKKNLDVVVFVEKSFLTFLDLCLDGIFINVEDKINSVTIVTNHKKPIKSKYKFNVINDFYFWKLFDPNFDYKNLFSNGWIKQQILKLHVDFLGLTNVLVVDGDLLFIRPIKFFENNKLNIYLNTEFNYFLQPLHFTLTHKLLNIKRQIKPHNSFITDFCLVNNKILCDLRKSIIVNTKLNLLSFLSSYLNNNTILHLSEYEIIGNFLFYNYQKLLNKVEISEDMLLCINLSFDNKNYEVLKKKLCMITTKKYQCIDVNNKINNIDLKYRVVSIEDLQPTYCEGKYC